MLKRLSRWTNTSPLLRPLGGRLCTTRVDVSTDFTRITRTELPTALAVKTAAMIATSPRPTSACIPKVLALVHFAPAHPSTRPIQQDKDRDFRLSDIDLLKGMQAEADESAENHQHTYSTAEIPIATGKSVAV